MSDTTVGEVDVAKEAWLAERRKHVTATDIGKIMGLSPYGGPTSVWLDKKTLAAPFVETERQGWGRRLEEAILAGYAHKRGVEVVLADPYELVVCPSHPLLAASLDGFVASTGTPVDAKNINRYDAQVWGDEDSAQIPDHYALQLAVQMMVKDAPMADLAVLFSGAKHVIYRVHRDAQVEKSIIESAQAWWDRYITAGVQPPPDGTEAYSDHLQKRLRQQTEALVDAPEEAAEWSAILRETEAKIETLAKVKEEAQQYLKEAIGDAAGIVGLGFRHTWKTAKSSPKTDWQGVLLALCDSMGDRLPKALVDEAIRKNTEEKPGSRRFLSKWTEQ